MTRLLPLILLLCCLAGCVSKQKPTRLDEAIAAVNESIAVSKTLALQRDSAFLLAQSAARQLDRSMKQTNEVIGIAETAQRQRDSIHHLLKVARIWIAVLESNLPDTISNKSFYRTTSTGRNAEIIKVITPQPWQLKQHQ